MLHPAPHTLLEFLCWTDVSLVTVVGTGLTSEWCVLALLCLGAVSQPLTPLGIHWS